MYPQSNKYFPFTSEHVNKRSKLTPLARLIHEILLSDFRTHEPESYPIHSHDILNIIQFRYNVKKLPTDEMICKEIYNLIDSELIVHINNGYQCKISFQDDDSVNSLLDRIRIQIDPEFRLPTLKRLIIQSSIKEIEKQLEYFKYRSNGWHESRIVMFCSYCKDFVPPPRKLEEIKNEVDKKEKERENELLKKKYNEYFDLKYSEFLNSLTEHEIEVYKKRVRSKIGVLYTTDNTEIFRAIFRQEITKLANIPSFKEWKK